MTDNINDDTLDNPINTQSENLSGEIISPIDTDIITPKKETENMEVHHHPDLHHKPKRWKEYLLEFLMIFLAVTMGFLAENLREHLGDKKREKELIIALNNDLVKDTIRLHHLINIYTPAYHSWIDSSHYAVDFLPLKGNEKRISKALFNATYWEVYTPPAIALTILQNPSSFNLIKNETVKREILNYNISVNDYNKYSEFLQGLQHSIDTSFASLVNREANRKLLDKLSARLFFLSDSDIPDSIVFKTYDKSLFTKFVNRLDQMDFKIHDVHSFCQNILNEDIKLLELFKEQYHLEDK